MKSNSETGHARNVSSLEKLVAICASFGEMYNPSIDAIKLAVMQILFENAKKSIEEINIAMPQNINAIAARKKAFELLDKLVTRVNNSFIAIVGSQNSINTSRGYIRKLQGRRAGRKKN